MDSLVGWAHERADKLTELGLRAEVGVNPARMNPSIALTVETAWGGGSLVAWESGESDVTVVELANLNVVRESSVTVQDLEGLERVLLDLLESLEVGPILG
jgi:hypothetical protein